ncbi:uncharacterized protein METZ01_LOCUS503174, partial [marine metagenome]
RQQRDHFRPRHHRGHKPRGPGIRPRQGRAGGRDPHLPHGTPLQHCAVADVVRGEGRQSTGRPGGRRRRAGHGGVRKAAGRSHQTGGGDPCVQRPRHGEPHRPDRQPGPRPGSARARGRRPGGAPHARRRAAARLRLLPILGPQVIWPDGYRRALRQETPARRHDALRGRRIHDQVRHPREDDLRRRAHQVRGGNPQHRRRRRPGGGHRLCQRHRPGSNRWLRIRPPRLRHPAA